MKTGTLKERQIKLIRKMYDENYNKLPTEYDYAEDGEVVYWDGQKADNPEHYGGREVLWCRLHSGESIGMTHEEVEWDEVPN